MADAAGAAWREAEVPGAGRGLVAVRPVAAGEVVLSVPLVKCWPHAEAARALLGSQLAAEGASQVAEVLGDLSEEAVVAIWLLAELDRGASSAFAASFAKLPESLDTALQWSEEELEGLAGTCFHHAAAGMREETEAEWQACQQWLSERMAASRTRFAWAKSIVLSRQIDMEKEGVLPEGSKIVAPGMDLLNHETLGRPNCEVDLEGEDEPAVVVRCVRDVDADEELRHSYGPSPNASLLMTYGFVAEANPFDCVEFVQTLAVPPTKRPWLRAIEAVAAGLDDGGGVSAFEVVLDPGDDAPADAGFVTRHNLFLETPLPGTLLATARLQTFQITELEAVASEGPADARRPCAGLLCSRPGKVASPSEGIAVRLVRAALERLRAAHPGSVAEDRRLLEAPEGSGPALSHRQRMAATVRVAEKEILAAALVAVEARQSSS